MANETWKFVQTKSKHVMKQVLGIRNEAACRVLRDVLNVREKERRQEVTPPVACARQGRVEASDDDDDDDDVNRVGVMGAAA